MDSDDDGGWFCESLRHVDVHAKLRRASIEIVDLLELAAAESDGQGEGCERAKEMHLARGIVCRMVIDHRRVEYCL